MLLQIFIYANNANRKFYTGYGTYPSFVRNGSTAKDKSLRKMSGSKLLYPKASLLALKGTETQKSWKSSPEYILQIPYWWLIRSGIERIKRHYFVNRIRRGHQTSSGLHVLTDKNIWKIQKNDKNNGIWSDHALLSSYTIVFLVSFTEYPHIEMGGILWKYVYRMKDYVHKRCQVCVSG